jgi:hypothetical protein
MFVCRGKGKSCPSHLTKHHVVQTYGGLEVQIHAFLKPRHWVEVWSASGPGHFAREEGTISPHWIGGWLGPAPLRTLW